MLVHGGRLLGLQVLRFVAATLVVYGHAVEAAATLSGRQGLFGARRLEDVGSFGVDVFFVLSGFIIATTGPLATPRPSGLVFYLRRLRRVVPLYWFCTAALALSIGEIGAVGSKRFLSSLTFWPVWDGAYLWPYLPTGWTLCFEMLFYSTVALVLLGGRVQRNLTIAAAVIALLVMLQMRIGGPVLRFLTNGIMAEFLFGVGLALAHPWLARFDWWLGLLLIGVVVVVLAAGAVVGYGDAANATASVLHGKGLSRALTFGFLAAVCVAGALMCEPLARRGVLTFLGDASYAIYLVQIPVLDAVIVHGAALKRLPPSLIVLIGLAITVAVASAAHWWIERPMIRVLRPRASDAAQATPADVARGPSLPTSGSI